jgi:hypothetical protein
MPTKKKKSVKASWPAPTSPSPPWKPPCASSAPASPASPRPMPGSRPSRACSPSPSTSPIPPRRWTGSSRAPSTAPRASRWTSPPSRRGCARSPPWPNPCLARPFLRRRRPGLAHPCRPPGRTPAAGDHGRAAARLRGRGADGPHRPSPRRPGGLCPPARQDPAHALRRGLSAGPGAGNRTGAGHAPRPCCTASPCARASTTPPAAKCARSMASTSTSNPGWWRWWAPMAPARAPCCA